MIRTSLPELDQESLSAPEHARKILALEALSKLAEQFARDTDLQSLLDSLALTVAGQFAVTSTLVVARAEVTNLVPPVFAATGKFKELSIDTRFCQSLLSLPQGASESFLTRISDTEQWLGDEYDALAELGRSDVRLYIPMVIDGRVLGIILLGPRVGNAELPDTDLKLLHTLVATITPLIATSLLYVEMSRLKARYVQILDSVPQAMFVFDPQGVVRTTNKTALDLATSCNSSLVDRPLIGLTLKEVFDANAFPEWAERLKAPDVKTSSKLLSTLMVKRDDGERTFSVRLSGLTGSQPGDYETILTLQDITDQHENELRMFELEKFAERGLMASAISHELNNYLGMILGGTELAQINLERGKTEKVASTLEKLKESISAMQRFTLGLTDLGRVHTQIRSEYLNDVVTNVLSFAMVQKRFGRINVKAQLGTDLPKIDIDKDQIAQVLINILNNAADAIAETGRNDGVIVVTTACLNACVSLAVSDNGKGMTSEVKEKLFKTQLTTKANGHGFGLMTCAKIIERHNATIDISSQVGFGTTFDMRFPKVCET